MLLSTISPCQPQWSLILQIPLSTGYGMSRPTSRNPSITSHNQFNSPRNQSISTYHRERRTASSRRNISNPYNLAIPPKKKRTRRIIQPSSEYEASIRPSLKSSQSSDTMNISPKAAVAPSKLMRQYQYSEKPAVTCTSFGHLENSQYQPLEKKSRTCGVLRDRLAALLVTFAIAVILAVAILLSIILPQKLIKPLPINVLMPLHIDPAPGAWDPLYEAYVSFSSTSSEDRADRQSV